jgi:glycosyltransferase involved in cell wall biosynthesis
VQPLARRWRRGVGPFGSGRLRRHRSPLDPSQPFVIFIESLQVGGTATYATAVAIRVRRRGHPVAVLCPAAELQAGTAMSGHRYLDQLDASGVYVHQLAEVSSPSIRSRSTRVRELVGLLRSYRHPVVILMMGYIDGGGPITLAGRLSRVRAIVRAELQPPMPPLSPGEIRTSRIRDVMTDRVIVGSEENRSALSDRMHRSLRRVRVIHTGVDLPKYVPGRGRQEIRAELGYADADLVVGTISRLVERKGVGDFLSAAALVLARQPRAKFLVVGDGVQRASLEAMANRLGSAGRIQFTGYRIDITELLAAMDVFVMASHFEGGPLILLEAMAMSLPTVATRVGMAPEILEDGRSARLVSPRAPTELAAAVTQLLAEPDLRRRLGLAARARVERDLTLDAMVDAYLSVCAEVAGRLHPPQPG